MIKVRLSIRKTIKQNKGTVELVKYFKRNYMGSYTKGEAGRLPKSQNNAS